MFTTQLLITGKEYSLRYTIKQQRDIKENAPKKLLGHIKNLRFNNPMDILAYMGDIDVQIYLLQKGLEWEGSGIEKGKITEEDAAQLRQDFLEEGEADSGEKYEALQELLAEALSLNTVGASGKKLREKGEQMKSQDHQKKVEELALIYEAQKVATARFEAHGKTGSIEQEKPLSEP